MSALENTRENLRREISDLLDKLSAGRAKVVFENAPEGFNSFLDDLEKLHRKTAALQALLALPEEQPVIVEKLVEKVVEKIVEVPQPIVTVPPVQVPETPVVPPPPPPPVAKTEPVVPEPKPQPVVVPEVKNEPVKMPEAPPVVPAAKTEEKKPEGKKRPDIRTFIGFNEKIMFMRLFNNEKAAYDEALDQVNASASWEEASAFLSVLAGEYKWNSNSESVQTFTDTVKRRFA